jgi:hypothetical protein
MDKPIYALSGYAEWFWLMAKNIKNVENRPRSLPKSIQLNLPIRIYLHASKTKASNDEIAFIGSKLNREQCLEFLDVDWYKLRGKIIGEITITRQFLKGKAPNPISSIGSGGAYSMGEEQVELMNLKKTLPEYFSPWAFGKFCYVVKGGILYDKFIPYNGQLGFFKPELN